LLSSYNSDLHELKSLFMMSFEELTNCLQVLPEFVIAMKPNRQRAAELLQRGHVLATEVADYLTQNGVPFREAYKQVAALVEAAQSQGIQLQELNEMEAKKLAPNLEFTFLQGLTPESAVERRQAQGGTSKEQLLNGLNQLQQVTANFRTAPTNGAAPHTYFGPGAGASGASSGRLWEMAEWLEE
jgi:argininosuccinate lyase